MSEKETIENTKEPIVFERIKNDLISIGLELGDTVLVHSSLSSIGWVCGGAITVIKALLDAVGVEGTVVMPTQTNNYSDPTYWENPAVPNGWIEVIKEHMPAYNKAISLSRGVGVLPEIFRNWPGAERSVHPQYSFASVGKNSEYVVRNQPLNYGLWKNSPIEKLFELDAKILFIGSDYDTNTSFHFAEYESDVRNKFLNGAPIIENGSRVWKEFDDIELSSEEFTEIGNDFEKTHNVSRGFIGQSKSKLFNQKESVDFAIEWFKKMKK